MKDLEINKDKVEKALDWLQEFNPLYLEVPRSDENLNALEGLSHIPEEHIRIIDDHEKRRHLDERGQDNTEEAIE